LPTFRESVGKQLYRRIVGVWEPFFVGADVIREEESALGAEC
jgi:hypothetical protein